MLFLAAGALSLPTGGGVDMYLKRIAVFIMRNAGIAVHMLLLAAAQNHFRGIAGRIMRMLFHDTDKTAFHVITGLIMNMFRHNAGEDSLFLTAVHIMEVFFLETAGWIMLLFSADKYIFIAVLRVGMFLVISAHISSRQSERR